MKILHTNDGRLILNKDKTITMIGQVAHEVYFGLHKLLRELNYNSNEISNDVYNILDNKQAISFQEINKIETMED